MEGSIGIVTNLLPLLGYKNASAVAKEALETGRPVMEIAARHAPAEDVARLLDPDEMTRAQG